MAAGDFCIWGSPNAQRLGGRGIPRHSSSAAPLLRSPSPPQIIVLPSPSARKQHRKQCRQQKSFSSAILHARFFGQMKNNV
jgi:hypothetical protein